MRPETIVGHFFSDPGVRLSFQHLGGGHINDTLLFRLADGRPFLLQRINAGVFREPALVLRNHLALDHHFRAIRSPLRYPRLIPTLEGAPGFCDEQGAWWRVQEFLTGTYALSLPRSDRDAFVAAAGYGVFIRDLNGLAPEQILPAIPDFHNSLLRYERFRQAVASAIPERLDQARQAVQAIREAAVLFERIDQLHLPLRLVHNDAKISNILFSESTGKVAGVVDWDTVMPGSPLVDFGDMIRSMAFSENEEATNLHEIRCLPKRYQALKTGFLDGLNGLLSKEEIDALPLGPPWIILEQAMRFLTDYLCGDTYYKVDHPRRNLDRALNQLHCFRLLQEAGLPGH